ncbi:MAG: penicillin-binding protein 2 [Dehalococcoidia bacterium]|nr:penicillin-binding protein 2 [Dehalococcoidia bacterium]
MKQLRGPTGGTRRVILLRGATVASFGVLGYQLWTLQVANGPRYRQRAEHNRLRQVTTKPLRGLAYDRKGHQLVRNVPNFSVVVRPADLPPVGQPLEDVLKRLGLALDLSTEALTERIEAGRSHPFEPLRVQSYIGRRAALILEEQRHLLPGVTILPTPMREYPDGALLGHILGYTGLIPAERLDQLLQLQYERDDVVGRSGLEAATEAHLRGRPGRMQVEVDAVGRTVNVLDTLVEAQPGRTVILTLDTRLQRAATRLLQQALDQTGAPNGAAIAMVPQTGEILAMVSLPGYDSNLFAGGISPNDYRDLSEDPRRPLVNTAIAGQYPPGSTFKIVVAAAALEERVVRPDQTVLCRGRIDLPGGFVFRDWLPSGHGPMAVVDAVARSCDVYFYSVSGSWQPAGITGLGPDKLGRYARLFGFGAPTGIGLPGEEPGLVPTTAWKQRVKGAPWYQGDSYNIGIGQGDLLSTPLQVINAINVIANGGTLYRPQLILEVRDSEGRLRQSFEPEAIRRVPVSARHLALIRRGLRESITSRQGTTYTALRDHTLAIAGKTGTAEVGRVAEPHAWFVGYAPATNPVISVIVLVQNGGQGSKVAAPVAADIMDLYVRDIDSRTEARPAA